MNLSIKYHLIKKNGIPLNESIPFLYFADLDVLLVSNYREFIVLAPWNGAQTR